MKTLNVCLRNGNGCGQVNFTTQSNNLNFTNKDVLFNKIADTIREQAIMLAVNITDKEIQVDAYLEYGVDPSSCYRDIYNCLKMEEVI